MISLVLNKFLSIHAVAAQRFIPAREWQSSVLENATDERATALEEGQVVATLELLA